MVASTVDIESYPSGVELPDGTDGVLRPATSMAWTGGTGPFNVRYEWDTVNTFDSGSLITVVNNSVTSPDSAVPTSDLGGSTWYTRATNIDTGDSNNELASSIHTLNYFDPDLSTRFLHLQTNLGVAFSPVDSPKEVQVIYHDHTGGTFTLSFDGQGPTSSINYNDPASTVKIRLESLSNITTVTVDDLTLPSGWTGWRVTFEDPGGESEPLITIGDSLTGGATAAVHEAADGAGWDDTSGTVGTEGADGFNDLLTRYLHLQTNLGVGFDGDAIYPQDDPREIQIIYHDATGGNFTLSFDGQGPTGNIAYNALPSAVESALEGLSNIDSVLVEDVVMNGATAWRVTFLDPNRTNEAQITINDTGLTGDTFAAVFTVQHGADWDGSTGEGTVGPDGQTAPNLLTQYLHLQTNLGVGFEPSDGKDIGGGALTPAGTDHWPADGYNNPPSPGEVGYGTSDLLDKFLHLQVNVTTTQPCPHVFSVVPTVVREGDGLLVTGQGLVSATFPTADAYDAEVRLYDSPSFAASYTTLTIVNYTAGETEDTISVQIPVSTTSGHLAVVHTTTPSCSGSGFTFVEVITQEADRDAGWWVEVWNLRGDQRLIANLPVKAEGTAFFQKIRNEVGGGWVVIPAQIDDPTGTVENIVDTICDPDADPKVSTLIRFYLDGLLRYGFHAEQRSDPYGEPGAKVVRLSGPGRENIVNWAIVENADAGLSSIIQNPDPVFGSTVELLSNPSFEDGANLIPNGDFETLETDPWEAVGTATIFLTQSTSQAGIASVEVTVNAINDGVRVAGSVEEGTTAFINGWARDIVSSGETAQLRAYYINDAEAEVALGDDTIALNVLWREAAFSVNIPDGVTSIFCEWRNTTGTTLFWADTNFGVADYGPWTKNSPLDDVRLDRTYVDDGVNAVKVITDVQNGGINQIHAVSPNTRVTYRARMTGTATETVRLRAIINGVAQVDERIIASTGVYENFTVTGTTGPDQTTVRVDCQGRETGVPALQTFYVDNTSGTPGNPATSGGDIVGDLVDAAQLRSVFPFLTYIFTALLDSKGEVWVDLALSLAIRHGRPIGEVLDQLVAFGLDWEVTDTYELRLLNTLGTDLTQLPAGEAPLIDSGKPIRSGAIDGETPRATFFFGEGAGGIKTTGSRPDWEDDIERREAWITNPGVADTETLGKLITTALDAEDARGLALKIELTRADSIRPFVDFDVGDVINIALELDTDQADGPTPIEGPFRVVAIAATLEAEGTGVTYTVDFNRLDYERELKVAQTLARLLAKGESATGLGRSTSPGGGTIGGAPIPVTTSPTTGGSTSIPAHKHTIPADIDNPGVGGDLAGQLPNPTVTRLRGRLLGTDTPADEDVLTWDDTAKLWTPQTGTASPAGVPIDSVIGRLYTRPTSVNGLTRTYKSESDEFDDGSITGWTAVDGGAGSNPSWYEEADVMGSVMPSGAANQTLHAQMKAIPTGDWTAEFALRMNAGLVNGFGFIIADGTTSGAGNQIWAGPFVNSSDPNINFGFDVVTNYGGTGSIAGITLTDHVSEVLYARIVWDDTAGDFDLQWSADGIVWTHDSGTDGINPSFTPTHFGIGHYNFSATWQQQHCSVEYFRVYTEA